MSTIADKIKTSQNKEGMLRRALERIIQLYTDKSHFVYELLQNAEDAEATCIRFVQYSDRLEVYHDGRPFTSDNLQGLCDIGKSDKVDNLNQIGEFGVGFKSVFGICETVLLYSKPEHYRGADIGDAVPFAVQIHDFTRPEDIKEVELEKAYTTKFVFPYSVGKTFSGFRSLNDLNETLTIKLCNLGVTTLLFMRHLELIEYQIKTGDHTIEGEYLLDKKVINDHYSQVNALASSCRGGEQAKNDQIVSFLKFSRYISQESERTVDIAFPVLIDGEGKCEFVSSKHPYVSVYFPTETESKLDFIVQGPYRTTPNRSSIPANDPDNIRLAQETAFLLRDSILELKASGMLNMSCLKLLPVSEAKFETYGLFLPLYETVRELFLTRELVPTKEGGYALVTCSKIARQEKLATTLNDALLTELINDGRQYHWLPTFLTETNREYEAVYRFLTGELKIGVVRPEDLRIYFASNPNFLPRRNDEWIVELYSILENVAAAFSKSKNETNMLVADIVKTSKGTFVAPYRRTESRQYIPNVFLQSDKIHSTEINYVDPKIYARCRHFFDDILQIQKPNEYEFFIKDIGKRYEKDYRFDEQGHIHDVQDLLKCLRNEDYREDAVHLIKSVFLLKCTDGKMRNPVMNRLYLPTSTDGTNIEGYYMNVMQKVFYVDMEYYTLHGVSVDSLKTLYVKDTILTGEDMTRGIYDAGGRGRQPEWYTAGDFRWKLSIDAIKEVLKYISKHSGSKDAILKSQTIMQLLFKNESKLTGTVIISGSTPNLTDETCELIKILKGERFFGWDGKWLFTESLELVSPKAVSKYDISTSIYGKIKPESSLYELLGFKKTEADEVDSIKKGITKKQLDALFEEELRQRFGISTEDLTQTFGTAAQQRTETHEDVIYPFPIGRVKNLDALRKHAAEMLLYSDPVVYTSVLRSIRVSNRPKEARAYLLNMYRYEGVYRYACQMCHEAGASIEATEIFKNPEAELDPMNLCLCPNCATAYRRIRDNEQEMKSFRQRILGVKEADILNGEQVAVPVGDHEIWFSQTHFAEVQELLKLSDEVKESRTKKAEPQQEPEEKPVEAKPLGADLIGKNIRRRTDGMQGTIAKIDKDYVHVDVIKGERAGQRISIQLSFVLKAGSIYEIS